MKLGPYLLGPNDTPENGIYTGDAKELAKLIPDESVDLIFTDPVYQNIEDYEWLAKTAEGILKPDRICLAYCGTKWKNATIRALEQNGLDYIWDIIIDTTTAIPIRDIELFATQLSCLVFAKGNAKLGWLRDL